MTTVGLELTNFIDPSLTWKTVSKGRNTSRRSRRTVSKISKLDQNQQKRNLKRLSETQSSESDKSDVSIERQGIGNMEHIPIKKRKFLLRSPSPPPQSPNHREESQELDKGCTFDLQSNFHGVTEPEVTGTDLSAGSVCKKTVLDANVENTASSFNGALVSSEDFSGIAILAAAALSDGLECTVDDVGKSKMDVMVKQEDDGSLASVTNIKDNIAISQSTDSLGKATGHLKNQSYVADLPNNNVRSVCLENTIVGDVGQTKMGDMLKREDNESFASGANMKENIAFAHATEILGKATGQHKDGGYVANSVNNSIQSVCVEKPTKDVGRSEISEHSRAEPNEPVVFVINKGKSVDYGGSPDPLNRGVVAAPDSTSDLPNKGIEIANKKVEDSRGKRDYGGSPDPLNRGVVAAPDSTSDLPNKGIEIANKKVEDSRGKRDYGGSPDPLNRGVVAAPDSTSDLPNKANKKVEDSRGKRDYRLHWDLNTVMDEWDHPLDDTFIDSSMRSSEVASTSGMCFQKSEHLEGSAPPGRSSATESGDGFIAQPAMVPENKALPDSGSFTSVITSFNKSGGSRLEESSSPNRPNGVRESKGQKNVIVAGVDSNIDQSFFMGINRCSSLVLDEGHDTSAFKNLIKVAEEGSRSTMKSEVHEIDFSIMPHCPSKLEGMVAPPATIFSEQAMNTVVEKGIEKNSIALCASRCITLENHGGRDSHISSDVSSQVTENTANVANVEGGYDSHLEDGELRETLGHLWEDNEGEDVETEHVDYDSDNREGVFSEAAYDYNDDSAQLSGEVLAVDCANQSCHLGKFNSIDNEPILDKIVEENSSFQHRNSSSATNAKLMDCVGLESPTPKACSVGQLDEENIVEGDCRNCGRSDVESDRRHKPEKEYDSDALRNCRGASASGSELQFSDRNPSSMRRSRSSNFDSMHHTEDSSELSRRQPSTQQMDRFGGRVRAWNVELKNGVGDSLPEEGERIVRVQEDTSKACQPRIISTSRSGYNPMRRGSSGDRDNNGYGTGMAKSRDISPEYNSRNRFDRMSNGVINRGFREGYRRPGMYEGGKSNRPLLNNFNKRERSFSPVDNRMNSHFPRNHGKSRSRSRTRSPDFRSEARLGRARLPYQQPGPTANHIRERRSPVRVFNQRPRFDNVKQHDCARPVMRPMRFNDTTTSGRDHDFAENDHFRRKPAHFLRNNRARSQSRSFSPEMRAPPYQPPSDHIRNRRSPPPARIFRHGQRYDNGNPPPGRPMTRPGRFNNDCQPGRGNDLNNGDDEYRRKPRNIFERIHPGRHYDEQGDGRRFQYDEQDNHSSPNFRRNDNYTRPGGGGGAGDRRPVEGFRREERGNNMRYNNNNNSSDRMFYSGPKQFGAMRDYDEDTLPRGSRP